MKAPLPVLAAWCMTAGMAAAQPLPPVAECRTIADSAERLQCYDEDANFDFAAVVRRELECDRVPRAADILRLLMRRNAVRSMAYYVADDVNYFSLTKPEKVDGLTVVAVFGFDETGRFPFVRSRGTAPGAVFGIVTRDPLGEVDRWRFRHSPGLLYEDTASNVKGAKDIACMRLGGSPATASAAGSASPPAAAPIASPPAGGADAAARKAFDEGLGPKPR